MPCGSKKYADRSPIGMKKPSKFGEESKIVTKVAGKKKRAKRPARRNA
jgi:hypothetical protein